MELRVEQNMLVIEFSFWEKVWGMHGAFRIPRNHVREMKSGLPKTSWRELRCPGTFVPGVIKAGTYYTPRGKEFWYVTRRDKKELTVELANEKYERIVLTLPKDAAIPLLP